MKTTDKEISRVFTGLAALFLAVATTMTTTAAQQPSGPSGATTGPLSAPDWSLQPNGGTELRELWTDVSGMTADKAPRIEGVGPATEIRATSPAFLLRPRWQLSGTYAVAVTFTFPKGRVGDVGLLIGGGEMACVVGVDGSVAFKSHNAMSAVTPGSILTGGGAVQIAVRVGPSQMSCAVNGVVRSRHPATDPGLAGAPGVYVASSGAVLVSGFSVETLSTSMEDR